MNHQWSIFDLGQRSSTRGHGLAPVHGMAATDPHKQVDLIHGMQAVACETTPRGETFFHGTSSCFPKDWGPPI